MFLLSTLFFTFLHRPEKFVTPRDSSVGSITRQQIHSWTPTCHRHVAEISEILLFSVAVASEKRYLPLESWDFSPSIDTFEIFFSVFSLKSSRLHWRLTSMKSKENILLQFVWLKVDGVDSSQWITCLRQNKIPRSTTLHNTESHSQFLRPLVRWEKFNFYSPFNSFFSSSQQNKFISIELVQ